MTVDGTFRRHLSCSPSHQKSGWKTHCFPPTKHLFPLASMCGLPQTGSGNRKDSASSLWVRGLSFLPPVRQRLNPPLLHSRSSHPSRNLRAKKGTQTKTSASTGSPRQTGCCRWSLNPAGQWGRRR